MVDLKACQAGIVVGNVATVVDVDQDNYGLSADSRRDVCVAAGRRTNRAAAGHVLNLESSLIEQIERDDIGFDRVYLQ